LKFKKIYTLGSSTRNIDEFLEILSFYKITCLVDIRRFPTSRFDHFKKENLKRQIEAKKLLYLWLGRELGGFRKEGYQEYINSESFRQGINTIIQYSEREILTLMCAERFPWKCHRIYIARILEKNGLEVEHIIEKDRIWKPKED
jgi:uncharacterized protein (DUF488 family)